MISNDPEFYIQGVLEGDRRILSKTITLVESGLDAHQELAQAIFNRLIPYPGTRMAMESGIDHETFPVEKYPHYTFPWHSERLLRRMVRIAWLKFYLRPSYLAGLLKNGYRFTGGQLVLFLKRLG